MYAYPVAGSTAVDFCAYDPDSRVLEIHYLDSGRYLYFEVPDDLAEGLVGTILTGGSAGSFIHTRIKTAGYRYSRIG